MNQPLNVYESWPLYDTVLISNNNNLKKIGGFVSSFKQLGALRDIPFFNIRNRASAGVAYNNFDSKEHLSFAYHCYSIGVQFIAPVGCEVTLDREDTDHITAQLFAAELIKHCSFELRISQDQKVENAVMLTPEGSGFGGIQMTKTLAFPTSSQSYHNGKHQLSNRWKFAEPIKLPRNVIIQGSLVFSEYARDMLKKMVGPGSIILDPESQGTPDLESAYMIRVSMFGKREVQQRGDLHFT